MKTPTKEKLAEKLAATIYDDIAGPLTAGEGLRRADLPRPAHHADDDRRPRDRLAQLRLRRRPPRRGRRRDARAPVRARRASSRPSASAPSLLILDEFQEIIELDPKLPKLLRSVLQEQPEVAHFYLGSKRHMMERIFNDANEPFWRSAKQLELGAIPAEPFAAFIAERFADDEPPRRAARSSTRSCASPAATPTRRRSSATSSGRRRRRAASRRPSASPPRSTASCAPSTPTSACSGTARRPTRSSSSQALAREAGPPVLRGLPPPPRRCRPCPRRRRRSRRSPATS